MIIALLLAVLGAATINPAVPQEPPAAQLHGRKKPGKPAMAGVLNLNRATVAELRLLPGIGQKRAEKIVERREKRPFATIDEVGRIKGLRAVVQRLRSHLSVTGDTTLHPLTATGAKR